VSPERTCDLSRPATRVASAAGTIPPTIGRVGEQSCRAASRNVPLDRLRESAGTLGWSPQQKRSSRLGIRFGGNVVVICPPNVLGPLAQEACRGLKRACL